MVYSTNTARSGKARHTIRRACLKAMLQTTGWHNLCAEMKESEVLVLIECMKDFEASTSQVMFCTHCART
ncbi:hypothetical protein GQ600_21424 [Phytophthora cactorum]|nr:hypothetical protein GQ600_21424 [Phytophthora cactorum]